LPVLESPTVDGGQILSKAFRRKSRILTDVRIQEGKGGGPANFAQVSARRSMMAGQAAPALYDASSFAQNFK
jgi:hypothetical protein